MPELTFGEFGKCFKKMAPVFPRQSWCAKHKQNKQRGKQLSPFFYPFFPTPLVPGSFSDSSFFSRWRPVG
jgi:hypothetical protein